MKNYFVWLTVISVLLTSSAWAGGSHRVRYREVRDEETQRIWNDGHIEVKSGFVSVYDNAGDLVARFKNDSLKSNGGGPSAFDIILAVGWTGLGVYLLYNVNKTLEDARDSWREAINVCTRRGHSREYCESIHPEPELTEEQMAQVAAAIAGIAFMGWRMIFDNEKHHYLSLSDSIIGTDRVDIIFSGNRTYNAFNRSLLSDLSNKRRDRLSFGIHPSPGQVVAKARIRF